MSDTLTTFSKRLCDEMKKQGKKPKDFAEAIGASAQNVSNYRNGKNLPSAEILVKISQQLNVSADYLLGISNSLHGKSEVSSADMIRDLVMIADRMGMGLSAHDDNFIFSVSPLGNAQSIPEEAYACALISFFDSWMKYRELLSGRHITKEEYSALIESCILRNYL